MSPALDFGLPIAKRQRLGDGLGDGQFEPQRGSRFFAPYRTIGLVSPTSVPFASVPLGTTTFQITTNVGRQLQTYDLRKGLALTFLTSPQTPRPITAICASRDRILAAWGRGQQQGGRCIWVFKRGKLLQEIEIPDGPGEIKHLHTMGPWLIGCGTQEVEVWKLSNGSYEHYTTLRPSRTGVRAGEDILSGHLVIMPTYLNKVLVARVDGIVEIWNIGVGKCVYAIWPPESNCGQVTALQPSTALSQVAIAYANGALIIHDIEFDQTTLSLRQSSFPVTSIAFRTDGAGAGEDGRDDGVMATGSIFSGDIVLWDLNHGGRVTGTLRTAHEITTKKGAGITKIEFLAGQGVLVSAGLDNALRSWIFDQNPFSPIPRQLHNRSGHAAPVTTLNFIPASADGSDAAGKWLLSASQGRDLWGFSLRRDGQSSELSQGNVKHKAKKIGHLRDTSSTLENLKAPPITKIACTLNRDGGMAAISGGVWRNKKSAHAAESSMTGWESIVTAHENDRVARTWFWGRKRAGRWTLKTSDGENVSAVAMTACGTFALVGSAGGAIDMYNLQSGIRRRQFPPQLNPAQAKATRLRELQAGEDSPPRGHSGNITGIAVDGLNQTVVSCSMDGSVRFWDFATGVEVYALQLTSCTASSLQYNAISGLISVACDDSNIRVLDLETKKIVRELRGCEGHIYDHCFSNDGRWVVSSSEDSVIRIFDLATGHLIDAFKTAPCKGLSFSSTGEYLATCHEGSIGINIWSNKSLFSHIVSRPIGNDMAVIDLTDSATFESASINPLMLDGGLIDGQIDNTAESQIDQLNKNLVTLSLTPKSRWQTLLHLDEIRARNKPTDAPTEAQKAPFFLPSTLLQAPQHQPLGPETQGAVSPRERSRISRVQQSLSDSGSHFSSLLTEYSMNGDPDASECMSYLSSLPPSQMDLEIRSLRMSEMVAFVGVLTARLERNRDFELANSFMACFLRMHGDVVQEAEDPALEDAVKKWHEAMRKEEDRLGQLVGYCKGIVDFLRSSR